MIRLSRQIVLILATAVLSGLCDPIADSLNALRSGQLDMAELHSLEISNPAARLFVEACIERSKGEVKSALQTAARLVALYPNDPDWTARAEIMVAGLYIETGRLDAAGVVAAQIPLLYEDPAIVAKAKALTAEIEQLKAAEEPGGDKE